MRAFSQVDVFSAEPLLGDPVAVVHDADGLSDDQIATFARWTNQHGVAFTDWSAACGATGYLTGFRSTFGKAGDARRLELCAVCFHGRDMRGHFPDPEQRERLTEIDWPARFRAAAEVADGLHAGNLLFATGDELACLPTETVEAIGRALLGTPVDR